MPESHSREMDHIAALQLFQGICEYLRCYGHDVGNPDDMTVGDLARDLWQSATPADADAMTSAARDVPSLRL